MVNIDQVERLVVVGQCLVVLPPVEMDFAQGTIGAGTLEDILIALEQREGTLCQNKWQVGILLFSHIVLGRKQLKCFWPLGGNKGIVVHAHRGQGL